MTQTSPVLPQAPEACARLWEFIKEIDVAMLTTVTEDGSLHSRPMATQQIDADHGELWFFTSIDSPKIADIYHERQVGLSYVSLVNQCYVSVSGRAFVVRDREKANELWTSAVKTWFPLGVNDPHLALLRVEVDTAQYWDTPASKMVHLVDFAKRTLTGRTSLNTSENVKVNLR